MKVLYALTLYTNSLHRHAVPQIDVQKQSLSEMQVAGERTHVIIVGYKCHIIQGTQSVHKNRKAHTFLGALEVVEELC